MSSFIFTILKTELTEIPQILKKCVGEYYNNTLCNAATWIFILWYILHVFFDLFLNVLLKKLRYKEYIRIRLKQSLWYLGFYMTAFLYCIAILVKNNASIGSLQRDPENNQNYTLGTLLLLSFYLHSFLWDWLKYTKFSAINFAVVALFLCVSHFLRLVEVSFTLSAVISFTQMFIEFTKCLMVSVKPTDFNMKLFIEGFFILHNFSFVCLYLFMVPLKIILPIYRGSILPISNASFLVIINLTAWLILEIYNSILYKSLHHWLYHTDKEKCASLLVCSMFPPRTDATYNLKELRRNVKERQAKEMAMRCPKNRRMVIQTLKCMMTLKRKLRQKRLNSDENKNLTNQEDKQSPDCDEVDFCGTPQQFSIQNSKHLQNIENN